LPQVFIEFGVQAIDQNLAVFSILYALLSVQEQV
jgi:hypothetical protein